ncbi:MAG: hypothetical protein K0Q74_891, partial [Gammaproteobacteria bacterium]|nr:hypothetical protein [Gammaproteobacteria bacterium]
MLLKSKLSRVFSRLLSATLALLALPLLISPSTLAQSNSLSAYSPETINECLLSPYPDQCLKDKEASQWRETDPTSLIPLDTRSYGLSGPFSLNAKYDADLAWIFGLNYTQMLSEQLGVALKTTFGANELRANITAGYAFSPNHQFKLTYEYLAQNLPFEFASGQETTWVNQYAIGGAYQFLIKHNVIHSLELSAHTIRASNKELSTVVFDQTDTGYSVNYRRIAGGTEDNAGATLNLYPFQNTLFNIGAGYSRLSYDTQYEDNQKRSIISYKAELAHVLHPRLQFKVGIDATASNTAHVAEISHILNKDLELSLKGEYSKGNAGQPDAKSVMLAVNYPAPQKYSIQKPTAFQELKQWIDKPVVFATRVLAIKDE